MSIDQNAALGSGAVKSELIERLRKAAALPNGLYAEAADALEALTMPTDPEVREALAMLRMLGGDTAEVATSVILAMQARIEKAEALLSECPKWLQCVPSHASGSTTDLLIDRIETFLKDTQS